jgi:2-polyprenyl-3-methyl-5-hydroxy-6-metoxy-1,4-benzoquinol methylase
LKADLSMIEEGWGPEIRTVLDVSCGIGTQTLGLAHRGILVTASDLSAGAISRARAEAQRGRSKSTSRCATCGRFTTTTIGTSTW